MFDSFAGIGKAIQQTIKASTFAILAVSIAILIGAIVALAMVPADKSKQALRTVAIIMGSLALIVAATSTKYFNPESMRSLGMAFIGIGAGILMIATSMLMIARLSVEDLTKAGVVIAGFMLIIALISKRAKEMAGSGLAFLGLAMALNLLVTAILAFAMMPINVLLKGGLAILGFMVELALAARIANGSKPGGFIAMAVALNLLIPALLLLSLIPVDKLLKGGTAIVGLMMSMGLAARLAGSSQMASLGKMALVIAVLAASALALTFVDTDKLKVAVAGLSAMMLSLGVMAKGAEKSTTGILSIALVLAVLTGSLIALEKLAPETATKNALAMAALVGAIGVILIAMAKLKVGVKEAAIAAGALDLALGIIIGGFTAIAAILGGIAKLVDHFAGDGATLKFFTEKALPMMEVAGQAIGKFFGSIASSFKEENPKEKTDTFAKGIEGISSLMEVMAKVKPETLASFTEFATALNQAGSANLKDAIANFIGKSGEEKSMSSQIEDFTTGLQTLIKSLKNVEPSDLDKANTAASIFATFARAAHEMPNTGAGAVDMLLGTKDIGEFANDFAQVGTAMETFIQSMDRVKLDKLKALVGSGKLDLVMHIFGVINKFSEEIDPSGGVKQAFTGNTTLGEFNEWFKGTGVAMEEFIASMDRVKLDKLNALINSGKLDLVMDILRTINDFSQELPETASIGGAFVGGNQMSLGWFVQSFKNLPDRLTEFLDSMDGLKLDKLKALVHGDENSKLNLVKRVVSEMAELATYDMPESGGLWGMITGSTISLDTFGSQLSKFAGGFVEMADTVKEWTPDESLIDKVGIIKEVSNVLNGIVPPEETFFEALTAWAKNEMQYAGISNLLRIVTYLSNTDSFPEGIDISERASQLATAASALGQIKPTSQGFFDAIHDWATQEVVDTGIISLTKAVKTINKNAPTEDPTPKISMLAKASTELNKIKTTDDGFFETIRKWAANQVNVAGVKHLTEAINEINEKSKGIKTGNISKLSTAATKVKEAVAIFEGMGSVPSGTNLVKLAENVSKFAGKLGNAKTAGLADKASAVVDSVNNLKGVTSAAASVKSASSSLVSAGKSLTSGYAKGISSGYSSVTSAVKSLTKGAKNAVDTSALYSVGKNVGKSLAKGMKDALPDCKAAADKLVEQAERAAKAKAEINSPSKVFMRIGEGLGEGFVMGINNFSNKVYSASANMASHSIEAANEALNSLDTAVNPTITPVLDLTEIQRGANQINALISQNEAINLSANMNNVPSRYATPGMLSQMYNKMYDPKSAIGVKLDDSVGNTNYFNITVDGTEDPEQFANTFVHRMEMLMSMGG